MSKRGFVFLQITLFVLPLLQEVFKRFCVFLQVCKLALLFLESIVSRDVGNLVRSAADGWEAPLENPETREVNVRDGEILSCSDLVDAEQQCQSHPGAIAVEMEGKGENYSKG